MSEWKLTHPIVYPTVDCAIFSDRDFKRIYLARKPGQTKWRFVGGFVDPLDDSYQSAAIREAKEETGLDCVVYEWITSAKIEDARYKDKEDKIITSLFAMYSVGDNEPKAMDDICELVLFDFEDLTDDMIVDEHIRIFLSLKAWHRSQYK